MDKLLLLFSVFLLGVVFLVLPVDTTPIDYFLFSDMKLPFATHVYFIGEKLTMIVLAYIIAIESKEYRGAIWCFFFLVVIDLADYLLSYNSVWFYISGLPVSINTAKVSIFGLVILNEWRKRIQ